MNLRSLLAATILSTLALSGAAGATPELEAAEPQTTEQENPNLKPSEPEKPGKETANPEADRLSELFEELSKASDPYDIISVETRIREQWVVVDSHAITLLMDRGRTAFAQSEFDVAEAHFSDVAKLVPTYVDVWFQLAALSKQADDYDQAARYLRTVVNLEPRHFDAWLMLAGIMSEVGSKQAAYNAYKKALTANPHIPEAEHAVESLKPDVEGRGI